MVQGKQPGHATWPCSGDQIHTTGKKDNYHRLATTREPLGIKYPFITPSSVAACGTPRKKLSVEWFIVNDGRSPSGATLCHRSNSLTTALTYGRFPRSARVGSLFGPITVSISA